MPIARGRKQRLNRPKRKPNPDPFYMDKEIVRIKPKIFNSLRNNQDFVAMIRMARVLNVLDYSAYLLINPPEFPTDSMRSRHRMRTLFNMAGYLAEALKVADSLRNQYHNDAAFHPLLELFDDDNKDHREVVRKIRNSAFHLDHEAKATAVILKDLKLSHYEFYSEVKGDMATAYFHLPDLLDINYFVDELKPNRSDRRALLELFESILEFNMAFVVAARSFVLGLGIKLGLIPGEIT